MQQSVAAPVRYVTAALLMELQGSWGTPEELLAREAQGARLAACP